MEGNGEFRCELYFGVFKELVRNRLKNNFRYILKKI